VSHIRVNRTEHALSPVESRRVDNALPAYMQDVLSENSATCVSTGITAPLAGVDEFASSSHHDSRPLTSLAPQPPHGTARTRRFPWSERFDHIFRNEGVTGSNPVSSTKRPGQGPFVVAP
jgi:hypothetical protein